jgi:hypothetical protein
MLLRCGGLRGGVNDTFPRITQISSDVWAKRSKNAKDTDPNDISTDAL